MENYNGYETYGTNNQSRPSNTAPGRYGSSSSSSAQYGTDRAYAGTSNYGQNIAASPYATNQASTSSYPYGYQAPVSQVAAAQQPSSYGHTTSSSSSSSKTRRNPTESSGKRSTSSAAATTSTRSPRHQSHPTIKEEEADNWDSAGAVGATPYVLSSLERSVMKAGQPLKRVPTDLREALIMLPNGSDIYPGPYRFYRDGDQIRAVPHPKGTLRFS